MVWFWS